MAKTTEVLNNDEKNQIPDSNERKIILLIGMGLNGISAPGTIPPVKGEEQFNEVADDMWSLLESIDTFIFGRVTFQLWSQFWPTHADSKDDFMRKYSKFVEEIQKICVSDSWKSVKWNNSRVIHSDELVAEITRLKKLPGKNLAIVGGAGVARSFTKLDLIDEYQFYLHQVIFGSGRPVLGVLDKERQLELVDVKTFQCGGIRLHYRSSK